MSSKSRFMPWPDTHATVGVSVGADGKTLPCCMWCGKVMPKSGWASKCPGKVRVGVRGLRPEKSALLCPKCTGPLGKNPKTFGARKYCQACHEEMARLVNNPMLFL